MQEDGRWITTKSGNKVFIKNKDINDYMNNKIRGNEMAIDSVTFQDEKYGKIIEEDDKGRIEIFKNVLKTKKDDDYYGFKYKDISAPIILRKEKRDGKWVMYDGQHRYIAYKQLGYKKIPFKWKDE